MIQILGFRNAGMVVFAIAALASCSDQRSTEILRPPSLTGLMSSVTSDLRSRIGRDGKFELNSTGMNGEISGSRAEELAAVWARRFAPLDMRWLTKTRGAPISVKQLAVCGRPLYAASSFEPLPNSVPAADRRMWGSWWLVTLCAGSEPQVSLAVSAQASEVGIDNGHLTFPFSSGNEFFPVGIPIGHADEYPLTPEAAAARVATLYGARVSRLPELVMPSRFGGFPQAARWRIHLDRTLTLQLGLSSLSSDEIYVGRGSLDPNNPVLESIAKTMQPTEAIFYFSPSATPGDTRASYAAHVGSKLSEAKAIRKPSSPLEFTVVGRGEPKQ